MTNPQAPAPTTMPDRLLSNGRAMDEASFAIDAAPSAAKPLPTHGMSASPDARLHSPQRPGRTYQLVSSLELRPPLASSRAGRVRLEVGTRASRAALVGS